MKRKLFFRLCPGFIAAVIIGTVSHEFGHFIVATASGCESTISYAYTHWEGCDISPAQRTWITLGGPVLTIICGTTGLILLYFFREDYRGKKQLTFLQWVVIYLALFWLRQSVNLFTWITGFVVNGEFSTMGDEIKLAKFCGWPQWSIVTVTAIIGLLVLYVVVKKFVPAAYRWTFLLSGLAGGVAGYIFWIYLVGPVVMP